MIEDDVIALLHKVRPLDDGPVQIVPAGEEELQRFQQTHGIALPGELKAWFRRCNGANVNPGGLNSLFARDGLTCLDWYFKQYPAWKARGWFPIAGDGCGNLYVLTTQIETPSTGTHPVCFLDQADFQKLTYVVASGLWKFLYFVLQSEILHDQGKHEYWPFDKVAVLAVDPTLAEASAIPLPWEIDAE